MSTNSDNNELVFYGGVSGGNKQGDELLQELSKYVISSVSDKYKLFQVQRDLKRGKKRLDSDNLGVNENE